MDLLRTTEGSTETLQYSHKGCWGPPHMVYWVPDYDLSSTRSHETILVLMDSLWNMALLQYGGLLCPGSLRKSGSEDAIHLITYTDQCTSRDFT